VQGLASEFAAASCFAQDLHDTGDGAHAFFVIQLCSGRSGWFKAIRDRVCDDGDARV